MIKMVAKCNYTYALSPSSQETSEELMRFVKELRRANSALVDAFEKAKKRQQAEKKRMKQELVSYMNKVQGNSAPTNEVSHYNVIWCTCDCDVM